MPHIQKHMNQMCSSWHLTLSQNVLEYFVRKRQMALNCCQTWNDAISEHLIYLPRLHCRNGSFEMHISSKVLAVWSDRWFGCLDANTKYHFGAQHTSSLPNNVECDAYELRVHINANRLFTVINSIERKMHVKVNSSMGNAPKLCA